jgi:hypothetical protein
MMAISPDTSVVAANSGGKAAWFHVFSDWRVMGFLNSLHYRGAGRLEYAIVTGLPIAAFIFGDMAASDCSERLI